ncbi:MAG: peptide chain release factor N(5)-glutamine methyltransferase [Candidatus Omnitrophica bacterium]|nr:peptide chain release factor N(5)-glutamine methyltransferase [Candidatus Omnitrophota bacterium]
MNEAELLFSEIFGCDRASLYLKKDIPLDKDKLSKVSSVLKRRFSGEPLQYILGKTEFMGLEFRVNPSVLIPRPETEILVETAIKILQPAAQGMKILEIGTGSGCIAISLAKLLKDVDIIATDISDNALEVAKGNARRHGVKINFILADLFNAVDCLMHPADLIISNPPYVASSEIASLQPEISYEPRIALDGGADGLDFYRRIINGAVDYLKKDGLLILEIGFDQSRAIADIFQKSGKFKIIEIAKDYSNIERVMVAAKNG